MFDPALLGIGRRFNATFAVYDEHKVLSIVEAGLTDLDPEDNSWEIAREHYEFNIVGAWVGEGTPAFVNTADVPSLFPVTNIGPDQQDQAHELAKAHVRAVMETFR